MNLYLIASYDSNLSFVDPPPRIIQCDKIDMNLVKDVESLRYIINEYYKDKILKGNLGIGSIDKLIYMGYDVIGRFKYHTYIILVDINHYKMKSFRRFLTLDQLLE